MKHLLFGFYWHVSGFYPREEYVNYKYREVVMSYKKIFYRLYKAQY